jgi:D-alanine--poly(phosphoribitol) ligase subunit 2
MKTQAMKPQEVKIPETPPMDVAGEIKSLIQEKFLADPGSPDEDLVNTGVVDSLTLIQLLVYLEERFGVTIPLSELEIDDIRSISSLARLVSERRLAMAAAANRRAS